MDFVEYEKMMAKLETIDKRLKVIEEMVGYIELKIKVEDGWEPED